MGDGKLVLGVDPSSGMIANARVPRACDWPRASSTFSDTSNMKCLPSIGPTNHVDRFMRPTVFHHIKLLTSIAAGLVLFFLLPAQWGVLVRVLASWIGGTTLFIVWVFVWMSSCSAEQLYVRYKEEDETAFIILVTVICAALLSLVAIVALLATVKQVSGSERTMHVLLAAGTVVSSWWLVPTIFTLHYTDEFYSASDDDRPLLFPDTRRPVFWDFAYFSFTIAAACQTADVSTANTSIRKVVLAHSLIAFLFNASILGFAVNVSASLFSN